jgi:hypothetical protein
MSPWLNLSATLLRRTPPRRSRSDLPSSIARELFREEWRAPTLPRPRVCVAYRVWHRTYVDDSVPSMNTDEVGNSQHASTPWESRWALSRGLSRSDHRGPLVRALLLVATLVVAVLVPWVVVPVTRDAVTPRPEAGAEAAARPTTDDGDSRIVGSAGCRGVSIGPCDSIQQRIRTNPPRNDVLTEGRRASDTRAPRAQERPAVRG